MRRIDTTRDSVLERARKDIGAKRLWKARDRLIAAVKHDGANQELLLLLGDVYFEMGDLPNAGRFWLLTERSDPRAEAAFVAFEERWGGNLGEKLKMVPIKRQVDDYQPLARERIRALQAQAGVSGIKWPRSTVAHEVVDEEEEPMTVGGWVAGAVIVILGPGLWLLGIATTIYLVVQWLG